METTAIHYIKEAAKKLAGSKLQKLGAAQTREMFEGVMRTVGLETREEVCLFVAQFDLSCQDRTSDMEDLARYFECSALDMMECIPALKSLESKGFLVRRNKRVENIFKQDFAVDESVMSAIIENKEIRLTPVKVEEIRIDKYEFCKQIAEKAENNETVTSDLLSFVQKLEESASGLDFVGALKTEVPDLENRMLFYQMCCDNFRKDGLGSSDIGDVMENLYSDAGRRISVRKSIVEEEHELMKLDLIEINEDDDTEITLAEKGKELFYGEDLQAFDKPCKCRDIYSFLEMVSSFFHSRRQFDINSKGGLYTRLRTIHRYETSNRNLPQLERLRRVIPDEFDRVLFYTAGHAMVEADTISLSREIKALYPLAERNSVINSFREKGHILQKQGLAEIEKSSSIFGEDTNLVLTNKGKEHLLGEDAALFIDEVTEKQLLACDKIADKKLFFSPGLVDQISLLRNSLNEEYYHGLCARLEENNLPTGIAVLLYGEPGTGKTESVMQIAKATGRAIFHVDISETKTCWFGESEKLIKKVFTDYRRICEKSRVKPILLFNEADAVFSKRKDVNAGSVAQTENAIQNIILEEMETLDGILIATTNLADNLDGAFERRFLFKIRFNKPTAEAKQQIWMDKMPALSAEDARALASAFDFTGGQIDNVVRKALMQEVITGGKPTLKSLIALCSEEKITTAASRPLGFH